MSTAFGSLSCWLSQDKCFSHRCFLNKHWSLTTLNVTQVHVLFLPDIPFWYKGFSLLLCKFLSCFLALYFSLALHCGQIPTIPALRSFQKSSLDGINSSIVSFPLLGRKDPIWKQGKKSEEVTEFSSPVTVHDNKDTRLSNCTLCRFCVQYYVGMMRKVSCSVPLTSTLIFVHQIYVINCLGALSKCVLVKTIHQRPWAGRIVVLMLNLCSQVWSMHWLSWQTGVTKYICLKREPWH